MTFRQAFAAVDSHESATPGDGPGHPGGGSSWRRPLPDRTLLSVSMVGTTLVRERRQYDDRHDQYSNFIEYRRREPHQGDRQR